MLFGVAIIGGIVPQRSAKSGRAEAEAAKSPQKRAAEKAARDKENARHTTAAIATAGFKQAMKDPSRSS